MGLTAEEYRAAIRQGAPADAPHDVEPVVKEWVLRGNPGEPPLVGARPDLHGAAKEAHERKLTRLGEVKKSLRKSRAGTPGPNIGGKEAQ